MKGGAQLVMTAEYAYKAACLSGGQKMQRWLHGEQLGVFGGGLLLVLLLSLFDFGWLGWSRGIDHWGNDALQKQYASRRDIARDVVVVNIDQHSLEQLAGEVGRWPWPRQVHAELIEGIARQQPKAIVFDLLFNEPDLDRPDSDAALADAVAAHKMVYLPTVLLQDGEGALANRELPSGLHGKAGPLARPDARSPLLLPAVIGDRSAWRGGLINFERDDDGVGRRYLLAGLHEGWRFASLPATLALDFGWPAPEGDSMTLNWPAGVRHVSYADLYADFNNEHPKRPANEFRNKIVVIGTAAPGLQDLRLTPLSDLHPGVDILATAIDNLQQQSWLYAPSRGWLWPLWLLLGGALAWAFRHGVSPLRSGATLLLVSLLAAGAAWAALGQRWLLPLWSSLAWAWIYYWLAALVAYLREREKRERAVRMFNRFLDPRVVQQLVASGRIDSQAGAQSRDITVLFSDIRGFTTLSESHSPEYIVNLLNRYFAMQVEIIFRHGGTLDKFIGDAIMAFWNAPVDDPEHGRRAVAAALEMSAALQRFRAELGEIGQGFDVGIGLHSGPAVVGFIGASERLDYTAIGDTVNLASRIEGLTKGVARVLVSDSTRQCCAGHYQFVDHGSFTVKGREQAVQLFEPKEKT